MYVIYIYIIFVWCSIAWENNGVGDKKKVLINELNCFEMLIFKGLITRQILHSSEGSILCTSSLFHKIFYDLRRFLSLKRLGRFVGDDEI